MAGLAYDPVADGYHLVVAAPTFTASGDETNLFGFTTYSSRAAWDGWRPSPPTCHVQLRPRKVHRPPEELRQQRLAYAGGRVHWLTADDRAVVWYDVAGERCGRAALPATDLERGCLLHHASWDIAAAPRGVIRLAWAGNAGVAVWEAALVAGSNAPPRWELVHKRRWSQVPGVPSHRGPGGDMWSVVPMGMEVTGEGGGIGLALRTVHTTRDRRQVYRRALVRYDPCTGAMTTLLEITGNDGDDDIGTVFGYHSSMAAMPA